MDSASETSSATNTTETEEILQIEPKMETDGFTRQKILGFRPQREIIYSKYLPYADKIDSESVEKLAEIKANLGRAVVLQEMRPGWEMWTGRLMKYIRLYGFKFSKEDHIAFIKLVYELLTIPGLEPYLVVKFAPVLHTLLKKKELLLPGGLELPWKPLFDLVERTLANQAISLGMYRYTVCLETVLDKLCHVARYYYSPSGTAELLALCKPRMCVHDSTAMLDVMETFDWFLPLQMDPSESHLGYELWFDELMALWDKCNNAVPWEEQLAWLMARLAMKTIGYCDWEKHMPSMFTRFLRSFSLPVTYNQITSSKADKIPTGAMTMWIVANLGGGSSCQDHLDQLLKAVESYFHPANIGRWCQRLKQLLSKLPHHFVSRLHQERHKKCWSGNEVPEHKRLTETDIDRFVLSMQPVIMQAMFSRFALNDTVKALQSLALLRPAIIIPPLIERMYYTLDSITEPHKLTCVMQCMVAVARPLVQSADIYPEGITHVIPLMIAVLPGIDPNDLHKCFVTFQFLSTFAILIPIVNSSDAAKYHDLTEAESIVCSATAQFEDFIVQFLDRLFILVESSVLESTRLEREQEIRSTMESLAEGAIDSITKTLLDQTSTQIFKVALDKLFAFVTSHILETKVSGSLLAHICGSFARVNPELTLHRFVPHLAKTILSLTAQGDVKAEESLDKELLYYLQILGGVVNVSSPCLLDYIPSLTQVMDISLYLSNKEGYTLAARILINTLTSATQIRPRDCKAINKSYDLPTSEFLPIREWGKNANLQELNLRWYVPGVAELTAVQDLVARYLPPEMERIDRFLSDEKSMDKKEMQRCLAVIVSVLGCSTVLAPWDEPIIHKQETRVPPTQWYLELGVSRYISLPDGSNIRKMLIDKISALQEKLLATCEDDTKALGFIITIWDYLTLNRFCTRDEFEKQWKGFHYLKKHLENRLIGQKSHIRTVLISRILLHHQTRQNTCCVLMTRSHEQVLHNLFTLSTSHYTEVRIKAQQKLFQLLESLPFSYFSLVPHIIDNLKKDPNTNHELFKGTLNVLLGPKRYPLIIRHNWGILNQLWGTLVRTIPSEKLSIVKLVETIRDVVHKQFPTITLELKVPSSCIQAAQSLLNGKSLPHPSLPTPTDSEREEGSATLSATGSSNNQLYDTLLESLCSAVTSENLHWRFKLLTFCLLRDLVHIDRDYPTSVVQLFLQTLISDSLEIRKIALRCTLFILKQQKRLHPKQTIDPYSVTIDPDNTKTSQITTKDQVTPNSVSKVIPGYRADNAWLQYSPAHIASDPVKWDQPRYVNPTCIGYNQWPEELEVYCPYHEQPSLERTFNQLSPSEQAVDMFFSQPDNVDKLMKYFSFEEKKDTDKFNGARMALWKGLFRNHGDKHLPLLKSHIEGFILEKNETLQRCAAEFISGLIKGSKHWPFSKVESLWSWLGPVLRTALSNMIAESVNDWGVAIASATKNRDPNRMHWLLSILTETSDKEEPSFIECGRLFALHCAMNQFQWRIYHLHSNVYETMLIPRLTHDFQNVRDRISSMLTNAFELDISFGDQRSPSPHIDQFVERFLPELNQLFDLWEIKHSKSSSLLDNLSESFKQSNMNKDDNKDTQTQDRLIRLFKSVSKCILGCLKRNLCSGLPCFYSLLPLLCLFENYESDDELKDTCKGTIAMLAQAMVLPEHIPAVLDNVTKVSQMNSWLARLSCLEFLKCFLFYNLNTMSSAPVWIARVYSLVLGTLRDERVEIREKSGVVLGSLIHVNFIRDQTELYTRLLKMCRKTYNRKASSGDVVTIHAGVIGLCAFVNASPYDVVPPVPEIFEILGEHLSDPQPIPATIRKTLGDFKRTHHGNWEIHKLKFTEQQLEVLDELVIPPSYYA
uniref:Proteasome activator complex subunit 4 n=1 Tax=Cacopsylla melanoneura TaxID=428564 RepID=A0A8D8S251_9HEMI